MTSEEINIGPFDANVNKKGWDIATIKKKYGTYYIDFTIDRKKEKYTILDNKSSVELEGDEPEFDKEYVFRYGGKGWTTKIVFAPLHSYTIPFISTFNLKYASNARFAYYFSKTENKPYLIKVSDDNINKYPINNNFKYNSGNEVPHPSRLNGDIQISVDNDNGKLYMSSQQLFGIFDLEKWKWNYLKVLSNGKHDEENKNDEPESLSIGELPFISVVLKNDNNKKRTEIFQRVPKEKKSTVMIDGKEMKLKKIWIHSRDCARCGQWIQGSRSRNLFIPKAEDNQENAVCLICADAVENMLSLEVDENLDGILDETVFSYMRTPEKYGFFKVDGSR